MSRDWPWDVLEIDPVADAGAVRRAYAARLKAIDIDAEPHLYAELRSAREEALWLVREGMAVEDEGAEPLADAPPLPTGARWPYAAPELALDRPAGGVAGALPGDPGATYIAPRQPARRGEVREVPAGPYTVFTVPEVVAGAPSEWLVMQERRVDGRLWEILSGDGDSRETGLDDAELEAARDCIKALLHDADRADIGRAGAIEQWLAEILAANWPRSAPLVAETAAAFGWERMAGSLGELPAVAFLNARLAELRSHRELTDFRHGNPLETQVVGKPPEDLASFATVEEARLVSLLLPGLVVSSPHLSDVDEAEAQRLLGEIVARADAATLTRRVEIEDWLAHVLAQAWPRSAPLLEPAFAAFGWEREAGQLGERPAVAYLHQRLRGLRFHSRVLEPGHLLHDAWLELSKPGPASTMDKLRGNRGKVEQLLAGVRQNFPELEHHLDAQRVASWERRKASGGSGSGFNFGWIILVVGVLRLLASVGSSDTSNDPQNRLLDTERNPAIVQQVDAVVTDVFGSDLNIDKVDSYDHGLAQTIRSNVLLDKSHDESQLVTIDKMRNLVRQRVYVAGHVEGGADLERTMRLRLDYMKAAQSVSPAACMFYFRTGDLSSAVNLSPAVRAREQIVAAELLSAGKLAPRKFTGPGRSTIPGEIMDKVRRDTGLPESTIDDALHEKGSDANRCTVLTSLLSATLASKAKERQTILRLL